MLSFSCLSVIQLYLKAISSGAEIAISPVFDAEGDAALSWTVTPPSGPTRTYATSGDESLRITVDEVGAYDVAVTLSVGGRTATQSKAGAFRVGVPDAYVSKTGSATFPYDTAAKATPDPFAALAVAVDGTTVHVGAGIYDIARALEVTDAVAIVGEGGRENTVLRHAADAPADSVLYVNNAGACVSGLTICGGPLAGGEIDPRGDHRVAMAAAVAACAASAAVTIRDSACVAKSYPRFWEDLAALKGEET